MMLVLPFYVFDEKIYRQLFCVYKRIDNSVLLCNLKYSWNCSNLSLKIKNGQVLDFSISQSDTAETRIDLQDYRVLRLGAPRGNNGSKRTWNAVISVLDLCTGI